MICVTCGHENAPASRFCPQCGQPLQTAATCPRCGSSNAPTSKYCNACGSPLGGDSLAPAHGGTANREGEGAQPAAAHPTAFAAGRYQVERFLGEGGKKRVYLAHDTKLDRDIAFALLKTEGLDEEGRARIRREAQAMARLGDHPHIVAVHDIGDEDGQPYLVCQYMAGGDVEDLLGRADGHRLTIDEALKIADEVCQALEHAHRHGVIHRDLKPGNVWLSGGDRGSGLGVGGPELAPSPAPTVKLGDFGLALSLDRSRLTQAGMMVGTVAYMSPEQALGGEVTPRSDLYSLGAMLYQLVTGRPPFVGDESVAIITQHLNTPPVAPSWQVPDLPTGLETLILRLLEKDPEKRPASAAEVRKALASVSPPSHPSPARGEGAIPSPLVGTANREGGGASPSPPLGVRGQSSLYRRVFVGREPELRKLEGAFDAALSGDGSLLMVVGEPGIGKTALCEQLATYVAVRGGKTLVGHSYEEGSHTLPYLPFVEALRSYVAARPPEALKEELGTGAGEVAKIISEVRDRLRIEPTPPAGDPDEERWRLLQAVTGFLRNAANVQPVLLVLEDLHWADRGTLDLLLHLARNLQAARLLVVGTYRDVEVDRAHPLSGALAELRRITAFDRVPLRGLTPDEVHRVINTVTGQEVRWSFAEAVHRQTEGNPLFVQEVLRYLVEEGLLVYREGRWEGRWRESGEPLPEMSIPEGLRDVIGKRLSRLSPECNRLLAIAAVIGREFDLGTLRDVGAMDEEALAGALEEAVHVGVVDEQSRPGVVRYRFSHAFFRQTLYEEMIAPRRLRLHQEVARALERQYGARLPEHAAELAEHFAQSTDAADLAKAVEYGELAAQRAMAVCAYGEAARLLERTIQVQEVLAPEDKGNRCDLLLELAEALMPGGEPQRVFEAIAPEALALAEAVEDGGRAAAACLAARQSLYRWGGGTVTRSPLMREWLERLDRYAEPGTPARVELDRGMASVLLGDGRWAEGYLRRARALEATGQAWGEALYSAFSMLVVYAAPGQWAETVQLGRQLLELPRHGVNGQTLHTALVHCQAVLLAAGERDQAERVWRDLEQIASRSRDATVALWPHELEVLRATLDGELEAALAAGERLVTQGEELGSPVAALSYAGDILFHPLLHLGRAEEAMAATDRAREHLGVGGTTAYRSGQRAQGLASMGRIEDARAHLRDALARLDVAAQRDLPIRNLLLVLEAAVALGDMEVVGLVAPRLQGLVAVGRYGVTSVTRPLGDAARLLGDRAAARAHYQRSLEWASKIRCRPEIALARIGLAQVLLDEAAEPSAHRAPVQGPESVEGPARRRPARGEPPAHPEPVEGRAEALRAEAREHLDFAIPEFQFMKMQPALEQALGYRASLKP